MPLGAPRGGGLALLFPAAIVAVAIALVIVVALGQLGGATSSARTEREVVTASKGIVQSTVTGTGNVEPVTEEDVDFQTGGTLRHVYVKEGAHVKKGQLLATLGDTSAELTLKQARATLSAARATLTSDEQELADSSDTSDTVEQSAEPEYVDYSPQTQTQTTTSATSSTTQTSTSQTSTTQTTQTSPSTPSTPTTPTTSTATTPTATTETTETTPSETATTSDQSSSGSASLGSGSSSTTSSTVTDATVDSDKLEVLDDEQTVRGDETALNETKLRAPVSGTITSLEDLTPGDTVSSGSDSSSSGDSSSSSDSSSADTTTAASSSADSAGSSSSSSATFAEIDSLRHLSMTVSFTEADIGKLKVGQPATVTIDALSGVELAAKVTSVDQIGTTSSDVVSYDATLTLTQHDARVKPGMSASASVIVGQAHGVTVPTEAISGSGSLSTVTEDVNGRDVKKKVIVGTRGDSRAVIVSGLKAGSEVVITETLPATGSSAETSTSQSSSSGTLGGSSFGRSSFGGGGFRGPVGGGGPP